MGELAVAAGTAGLIGGQVVDLEAEGSLTNRKAARSRSQGDAGLHPHPQDRRPFSSVAEVRCAAGGRRR